MRRILIILVAVSIILTSTSCNKPNVTDSQELDVISKTNTSAQEQDILFDDSSSDLISLETKTPDSQEFDVLLNNCFRDLVSFESYIINSFCEKPENVGLEGIKLALPSQTKESFSKYISTCYNILDKLNNINYNELSTSQQIDYDTLKIFCEKEVATEEFYYYIDPLTNGVVDKISNTILYFIIENQADIDNYLFLLSDIERYFDEVIRYEKERAEKGMFTNDITLQRLIDNLELSSRGMSNLIYTNNRMINKLFDIPKDTRESYKTQIEELINNKVAPAYKNIILELNNLSNQTTQVQGLCNYEKGKEYYEYIVKKTCGITENVYDLNLKLDRYIIEYLQKFNYINSRKVLYNIEGIIEFSERPLDYINNLRELSKDMFPYPENEAAYRYIVSSGLNIDNIAGQYKPPYRIDQYTSKIHEIYLIADKSVDIYKVYAHESFPGHLLQYTYFDSLNPHPIRYYLVNKGYVEGWATYAGNYAYNYLDIEPKKAESLMSIDYYSILFNTKLSLGLHYEGWDFDEFSSNFRRINRDENIALESYNNTINNPMFYLPYGIGLINMLELKEKAQNELKDKYNEKDFHTFILNCGPTDFTVIEKHLDNWIKNKGKEINN